jgi:cytochrome c553
MQTMSKRLFAAMLGAAATFAIASVPAGAQDNIASKVQICGACHGQNGQPTDPKTMPIIWGQQSSYIFKQLHDYRSGDRENPTMGIIAKSLAQQDMRPIAKYFAEKTWPAKAASAPAAQPPAKIGQCQACHQPKFEGGPPAPRLAGLTYEYLIGAMEAFANDHRTNNLDMPGIMKALTKAEREEMAHYISSL